MKRKIRIFVFALFLLAGGTWFLLSGKANGDNDMNVPIFESIPDKMVIYQGDMALVRDEMKIYSGGEVQVILPLQAIPETVQIYDGGNKINNFNLSFDAGRSKNYTASGTGIKNLLIWNSKKAGSRLIKLDYMMRGMSWTPSYIMEIVNDQQVKLNYRVGIRNQSGAGAEVDLILVSGEIGSPSTGSGYYYRSMNNAQAVLNAYEKQGDVSRATGSASLNATKINAYYTYKMPRSRLEKNGVSFVTIVDKSLSAEKDFVWATHTGEKVDIIYTVKNDTDSPFAEGLVSVYSKGIFIGSDIIEWTPSGAKGHVTVGGAVDIQARKTVDIDEIAERKHVKEYRHKIELIVENFSTEIRAVKIIEPKYPDAVEVDFQTKPGRSEANTHLWNVTIPPKSKKTVEYNFFSDTRYQNPYSKYN